MENNLFPWEPWVPADVREWYETSDVTFVDRENSLLIFRVLNSPHLAATYPKLMEEFIDVVGKRPLIVGLLEEAIGALDGFNTMMEDKVFRGRLDIAPIEKAIKHLETDVFSYDAKLKKRSKEAIEALNSVIQEHDKLKQRWDNTYSGGADSREFGTDEIKFIPFPNDDYFLRGKKLNSTRARAYYCAAKLRLFLIQNIGQPHHEEVAAMVSAFFDLELTADDIRKNTENIKDHPYYRKITQ